MARCRGTTAACSGVKRIGMLAMLVHAWADFNFHIPANAIYFSFLAGVFFHRETAHAPAPSQAARSAGRS